MSTTPQSEEDFDAAVQAKVQEVLHAQARKRGLLGGPARAAALSPRRRKQIAKKAAKARWNKGKL